MKNIKFADFNSGWGGLGNTTVPKEAYFVLFKNNMVIGLSMLRDSNEVEGAMSSHFTSIIEEEQGKGYSKLILEKKIEYLKSINKSLHNSMYTSPGFNCLRSKTIELCEQNGVDLFENGLLGVADSFDQEVFKIQNELKKSIQSAKLNNRDLLPTKNGQIDPSLYKSIIIEFLKINIHNVDKKDWQNIANRYSMFFDEYSLELLKKIKT